MELPGGARTVCEVCRNGLGGAMWKHALGPWLEVPGWHETYDGCAEMGAGTPCGRTRWGHRWSSLRCTKRVRRVPISAGTLCGRTRWGHRWSCLGGTNRVMGVPRWGRGRHVDALDGAVGGAPWGARNVRGVCRNGRGTPCGCTRCVHRWSSLLRGTRRVRGVSKWARGRHVDVPVVAMGGIPPAPGPGCRGPEAPGPGGAMGLETRGPGGAGAGGAGNGRRQGPAALGRPEVPGPGGARTGRRRDPVGGARTWRRQDLEAPEPGGAGTRPGGAGTRRRRDPEAPEPGGARTRRRRDRDAPGQAPGSGGAGIRRRRDPEAPGPRGAGTQRRRDPEAPGPRQIRSKGAGG